MPFLPQLPLPRVAWLVLTLVPMTACSGPSHPVTGEPDNLSFQLWQGDKALLPLNREKESPAPAWVWTPPRTGPRFASAQGAAPVSYPEEEAAEQACEHALKGLARSISVRVRATQEYSGTGWMVVDEARFDVPGGTEQRLKQQGTMQETAVHEPDATAFCLVGLKAPTCGPAMPYVSLANGEGGRPHWVNDVPQVEGWYVVQSSAEANELLAASLAAADEAALVELARAAWVKLEGMVERSNHTIVEASRTSTDVTLRGARILARWFNKKDNEYHSLAAVHGGCASKK